MANARLAQKRSGLQDVIRPEFLAFFKHERNAVIRVFQMENVRRRAALAIALRPQGKSSTTARQTMAICASVILGS